MFSEFQLKQLVILAYWARSELHTSMESPEQRYGSFKNYVHNWRWVSGQTFTIFSTWKLTTEVSVWSKKQKNISNYFLNDP